MSWLFDNIFRCGKCRSQKVSKILYNILLILCYFYRHFIILVENKESFDEICYLAYISWSKFARIDGFVKHLYAGSTTWFHVLSLNRSRCCSHRSVIGVILRERPRIPSRPCHCAGIKVEPSHCAGNSRSLPLCRKVEPALLENKDYLPTAGYTNILTLDKLTIHCWLLTTLNTLYSKLFVYK